MLNGWDVTQVMGRATPATVSFVPKVWEWHQQDYSATMLGIQGSAKANVGSMC